MKLTKVVYVNLKKQADWDLLMRIWLELMSVPRNDILRIEGVDGSQWQSIKAISAAAADDGFPHFQKIGVPDWFGVGDLAVNWMWCRVLREITKIRADEAWFVLLDDEFILHPFPVFKQIIESAPRFDFIQFMHWDPTTDIGDREILKRMQNAPPLKICDFDSRFLIGGHTRYPGDNANAFTAQGAAKILEYLSKNPHVFVEAMPTYFDRDINDWMIISPASKNLKYWTTTYYRESHREQVNNASDSPDESSNTLTEFASKYGSVLGERLKTLLLMYAPQSNPYIVRNQNENHRFSGVEE